jgi:hypothetical protein
MEYFTPALEVGTPKMALNSKWLLGHITGFSESYPVDINFYFRNHLLKKPNSGETFFLTSSMLCSTISLRNVLAFCPCVFDI